jgi:hypothetical protein
MKDRKKILWSVLEKYDGISNLNKFCDSISNFIQDKQNGDDIINVYQSFDNIEKSDLSKIKNTIGGDIDLFLFSI